MSQRIVHCGGQGSGYRMKLVNQTIVAGTLLGLAQAAALARASGFDAALVRIALGTGTASGLLFDSYIERMIEPGGATTFTLGMLRKDLMLAREDALPCGADASLIDFALASIDEVRARFGDDAGVQRLAADRDFGRTHVAAHV